MPVDQAVPYRAAKQAVVRIDAGEPVGELMLHLGQPLGRRGALYVAHVGWLVRVALALRRIPAGPGRANGVSA